MTATEQPLTREEVKKHNTEDDLWCIVDHKVYDLTDFLDAHPGGNIVLTQVAGEDATEAFVRSTAPTADPTPDLPLTDNSP